MWAKYKGSDREPSFPRSLPRHVVEPPTSPRARDYFVIVENKKEVRVPSAFHVEGGTGAFGAK